MSDSDVFEQEILEAPAVCSHCFERVVEVVEAKKIIREERDYGIFGEKDRCYLSIPPLNDEPLELHLPIEVAVDDEDQNYCDSCGQELGAEGWDCTRSKTEAVRHARNAARVLTERGYNLDEDVLIQEVRRAKTGEGHRREYDIFSDAVAKALER
jgi:transposase